MFCVSCLPRCVWWLGCALFFFNVTATTTIYTYAHTLSLHDALPVWCPSAEIELSGEPPPPAPPLKGRGEVYPCPNAQTPPSQLSRALRVTACARPSEERRVGKECDSTCSSRWSPCT